MDPQNADVKRIDEYINSLDKVAAKKRKAAYLILIPLFVLVIVVSLIFYSYSPKEPTLISEKELEASSISIFSDLNFSQVRDHFKQDKGALEVEVPELKKVVHLHSEKEYWELLEELSVHFLDDNDLELAERVEEESSPSSVASVPLLVTTQQRDRNLYESPNQVKNVQTPSIRRKKKTETEVNKQEVLEITPMSADKQQSEEIPSESVVEVPSSSIQPTAEIFEVKTTEVISREKESSPSLMKVQNSTESQNRTTAAAEKSTRSSTQPLVVASKNPSFPGGETDLAAYLNSKIKYPQPARDYHVEGTVYVQFVIQSDGSLTNHKILRGIGYGCDEEALRIAQSMPNWSPGEQNGEAVPVWFTLPVKFDLLN